MQHVTTNALAKVAVAATVFSMAVSFLAVPANAATSCSFTRDLTIGARGADVTCLQSWLISSGYSIPAGATGYFGMQTKAAVSAWQAAMGISPTAGYFGPKSRAAAAGASSGNSGLPAGCTSTSGYSPTTGMPCSGASNSGTGTVPIGSGTGLKVMLSPTSPNGTVLVQGQGIGDLADFTFANPTSSAINVTTLTFKRIGVSNDATLNNVYLYQGVNRITDSAGVSSSQFSFTSPAGIFTVQPGMSVTISVRADIAGSTSGQQVGAELVSVASSGTLDASVALPVIGGFQTISAASLATVSFNSNTTPATTSISPQANYPVWQNTVQISTNPVKLTSMKFTNLGSTGTSAIGNFRLYVDGVQAGNAVASLDANRSVTFDLSGSPLSLSTQGHVIKVLADVTGGASLTVQMSVQRSSDAMFVDSQLGQPVTPTVGSSTFTAVSAGVITINSVSGSSGVSVTLDPASPTNNVAAGATNVKWASFDMLASGENVKVNDLYVYDTTSVHAGGLANGKVYLNGVQVGSTKSIGEGSSNQTDFALGSSLILPAGTVTHVDIYADAKTSTSTNLSNNETVTVSLAAGSSNAQGQSSLNSANVPGALTSGNQITVSSSALTATRYSGYSNQTVVAGTNNAKIGAFTLSAGSTEGVTVNTVALTMSTANAASLTNLWLKDDSMSGGCSSSAGMLGTVITTPSSSNSFSVNSDIGASQSKTYDVCANILSGANAGGVTLTVGTATAGTGDITGSSVSPSATALQTITVGNGSLTVAKGAGDPVSANVIAGTAHVKMGQWTFSAQSTSYTVQKLSVLVPHSVINNVQQVTVSYKDASGTTQTQSQPVQDNGSTNATATFDGLTMYVPANDSASVDVYVDLPTVASGAWPSAGINLTLDTGATSGTFKAINAAGSATTQVNSGTSIASGGTFYVHKSLPTFATLTPGGSSTSPTNPLYRFSISADPAGAVEWTKLKFTVATTSATITNVYLVDESTGLNLLDNNTTSASTTGTAITVDLTKNATQAQYAQVAAGTTKTYDLDGTVGSFTTGSTITINLAQDTSTTAKSDAATVAAIPSSVVWSDRSATTSAHSISTTDWTNGYLLQNFTTNFTTYSK
jgi:hypothetical protein